MEECYIHITGFSQYSNTFIAYSNNTNVECYSDIRSKYRIA